MLLSVHPVQLGEYRIIATLGRGGMAEVFLAVRGGLVGFTKLVVVKRLRTDLTAMPEVASFRALLLDEARLAARLRHPNIVQTFEVNEHEGEPFMAMEYLDGQPLNQVLIAAQRAGKAIPLELSLRVVADVLNALEYAHELRDYDGTPLGVVHRDVSPQNVFLTYDGEVKLVDFGVAKSTTGTEETAIGVVKGKVAYMAPEQARGEPVDGRADVFAVGVMLWELLANQRLLKMETPAASLQRLLYEPLPKLESIKPDIDRSISRICSRALERDVSRRYPRAAEMRADIERVLETSRPLRRDDLASFVRGLFVKERAEVTERIRAAITQPVAADEDIVSLSARSAIEQDAIGTTVEPTAPPHTAGSATPPPTVGKRSTRGLYAVIGGVSVVGVIAAAIVIRIVTRGTDHATAASAASASASVTVPHHDPELLLCGSNTIGSELGPAIVEAFLKKKGAASLRRLPGAPQQVTLAADMSGAPISVDLRSSGTATAFEGLAAGTCDVGMASRAINDREVANLSAHGYGDLRSPATEHVIGLDGIAVVVHPNNRVRTLDRTTLHDIFTGKIVDWSGIGQSAGPITVLARDDKSGTFDTFKSLVLGSDEMTSSAKRFIESDALSDAVASDPSTIGFIGLAYVRSAKAVAVGDRNAPATLPTSFTVTTEEYMLSRRLFFYTTPKPRTPLVAELVSFALSAEGQAVVRATSFVDLSVGMREGDTCDAKCPPHYAELTAHAQRLSLDFRFRPASNELDSRAERDLDRIVQFLRAHPDGRLMLLGFSDSSGDPRANLRLSQGRAQAVSQELATRGIHASVVEGFGAAMPIASNTNDRERERNRRVEVWMH